MDADDVRTLLCQRLGIRLEPEMCGYVMRRLQEADASSVPLDEIPVMGGDARTGVALRTVVPLHMLTVTAAVQP